MLYFLIQVLCMVKGNHLIAPPMDDIHGAIDVLHAVDIRKLIDEQISELSNQLANANDSHSSVQEQLQNTTDKLQSELEMAEAAAKNDNEALEAHVVKELESLDSLFSKRHQELLEKLQQVTRDLSESKTDRKTLANLLSTMATNLATDH